MSERARTRLRLGVPAMSASRAIERLVKGGVLKEVTGRNWNRVYEAKEVLLALGGFAARGGRRATQPALAGPEMPSVDQNAR